MDASQADFFPFPKKTELVSYTVSKEGHIKLSI